MDLILAQDDKYNSLSNQGDEAQETRISNFLDEDLDDVFNAQQEIKIDKARMIKVKSSFYI